MMANSLVVACGTYDGSVFAMLYSHEQINNTGPAPLKACLVDPAAHSGAVTALATKRDFIISGSTDESLQVFSLSNRTRLGSLDLHTGTIRQLDFSADSAPASLLHLFSASDDGCIAIWRAEINSRMPNPSAWECIRVLRRHKGPVLSMAIHPSNHYAYSLSEDKVFRVWNLMRGRQAYATRLKNIADGAQTVQISPTGKRILFGWPNRFDVVDLSGAESENDQNSGRCLGSVHFPQQLSATAVFHSEDDDNNDGSKQPLFVYMLAGLDALLHAFRLPISPKSKSAKTAEEMGQLKLPGKRIKFIKVLHWPQCFREQSPPVYGFRSRLTIVATTESSGSHLRGYCINFHSCQTLEVDKSFFPVFTYDIPSVRITSLAVDWLPENKSELCDPNGDVSMSNDSQPT
ncbi:unnamed protein product [Calicophoron daubneyi]|uniref:Uncharacterized protein n=1 Tax=Calicophoron daubneyi TaxID=300641 RepID=A0AAV2T4P4_CALDB